MAGPRLDEGVGAPTGELARGLYFYHARYYDPTLARFIQPDTIVPEPGDPQSLNRYSYVANNPVVYNDPSGHCPTCIGAFVGGLVNGGLYLWNESRQPDGIDLHINISINNGLNVDVGDDWGDFLVATGEGAAAGALIMTPGGQAAGVSMAASLLSDQVDNLVTGEDFNATEHLIEGAVGAVSGSTSTFVTGVVKNSAVVAGMSGMEAEVTASALNSGFWGGVKGGAKAIAKGSNVGRGILSGAGKGALSGAWSKGAYLNSGANTDPALTELGKAGVNLGQKVFVKSIISMPEWIYRYGMNQQRLYEDAYTSPKMY